MNNKSTKLLVLMFFVGSLIAFSQTLNQNANWPDSNWQLSGNYGDSGLLSNPTVSGTTLTWDDDAAGSGSSHIFQLTSPTIDLTASNTANETWITISGNYVYRAYGGDVLLIETYDADTMIWSTLHSFSGNSPNTDYQTCASTQSYTTTVLDISGYTSTQLSGFKYRISYDDNGSWNWGWCVNSPTISSIQPPLCIDPSELTASNIDGFSADISWVDNNSTTLWNIELVDITANETVTGTPSFSGVSNPYNLSGLQPSNDYEYYVQADCGVDGTSNWVGPFTFSTLVACPVPSGLTAENILSTSVDLQWIAGASETTWDIEFDVAGFVATEVPTNSGVTYPYSITGLLPNTSYDFYVRADCDSNGFSTWVGPYTFKTACTAFVAPYTQDFETTGVLPDCWSFGGDEEWLFENSGPNHVGSAGQLAGNTMSNSFYAVVDDSSPDATNALLESPFVDLSALIAPSLTFYEISDNEGYANATLTVSVWDGSAWNNVGIYNSNTSGWKQQIIDLSALTFTGPAKVRFSVADSGSFYDDIAIDDVVFDEMPTCPTPYALSIANITDDSADLSWIENGVASAWNIEIDTAGFTPTGTPTNVNVTNPFTVSGLMENTAYEFYVQSDCGSETSDWVGPFMFNTLEVCPAPSELDATNVIDVSADLSWTENGLASLWNIELGASGFSPTGTPTFTGVSNPYTAQSLSPETDYEFYVQASCGVDGASAWVGPYAFTTSAPVPLNDLCTGAFSISLGESLIGTTQGATGSDRTTTCSGTIGNDVWYKIIGDGAEITIDVNQPVQIDVYESADGTCSAFTEGNCYANEAGYGFPTPSVTFATTLGVTYYINIGYWTNYNSIDFTFTINASSSALSIDENNLNSFKLYPNPVNDVLNIESVSTLERVEVYNTLGQLVIKNTEVKQNYSIDMTALKPGVYFIKVYEANVSKTIRIIKN